MTDKIRICWPDPDATCLEGGCVYCQYAPRRALSTVIKWAQKAGQVPDRCGGTTKDAMTALRYGWRV